MPIDSPSRMLRQKRFISFMKWHNLVTFFTNILNRTRVFDLKLHSVNVLHAKMATYLTDRKKIHGSNPKISRILLVFHMCVCVFNVYMCFHINKVDGSFEHILIGTAFPTGYLLTRYKCSRIFNKKSYTYMAHIQSRRFTCTTQTCWKSSAYYVKMFAKEK